MNLGFDIDEVVVDIITPTLKKVNKINNTNYTIDDIFEYDLKGIGIKDALTFFHTHGTKICDEALPINDSIKYLKKLYEEGHKLHFITSRDYTDDVPGRFLDWLDKYDVKADSVIGYVLDKGPTALQLKLDFYIDDNVRQIENVLKAGIKNVVLFDKPYNREYKGERDYNWKGIYKHIQKIEKKTERFK